MMKVLLTGATGFVGTYVQRTLSTLPMVDQEGMAIDLLDSPKVESFIKDSDFDAVIHLAALSSVAQSFQDPRLTWEVNLWGTFNLLQALKKKKFNGAFLYVSSSEVYGKVSEDQLGVKENFSLKPISPYGASKAAAEHLCFQWGETNGFSVVMVRPFNHTGPGQEDRFVLSSFAKQLAKIFLGNQEPCLKVGNIEVARDFLDVRDVVKAYQLILERAALPDFRSQVFNVCSGHAISLKEILQAQISCMNIPVEIKQDPQLVRPVEVLKIYGDSSRLKKLIPWKPQYSIFDTFSQMVDFWKEELS
ncbi:MAG: GDP-mannose 4,6-dehydratase [Deltaproteobacteria bacterium]|nr:GDP-mannose 4,6-dehydratase [Deltaproteobacteria bacterium]